MGLSPRCLRNMNFFVNANILVKNEAMLHG
jgi:hypothetical protein